MPELRCVILLAVLLGAGSSAVATTARPRHDAVPARASVATRDTALLSLRKRLIARIESGELPSISIALVREGRVAWLEALGWADRENHLPADPQTLYSLGSLSKSITGTALMRLVDRGRAQLDDRVAGLGLRLPDPLHVAGGLEVRHLLQMTGGIPHGRWQRPVAVASGGADVESLLAVYGGPVARPGERFLYSNMSFGALEVVIEHASGRRFGEFLRGDLFRPLAMTHSGAEPDPAWRAAWKYDRQGARLAADYSFVPRGGGGLHSCAADLARFALLHLGALPPDSVLSAAALRRLHDARQPGEPSDRRYIGGWGIIDDGHTRSLLSDGQVEGASSALLLVPEWSIGVVCLVNRSGNDALPAAIDIVNALRPGYRDAVFDYIGRMEAAEAGGVNMLPRIAGSWAGLVWCGADSVATRLIVPSAGEPTISVAGVGDAPLRDAFYSERPDTVVEGITFRSMELTGAVAGLDLVARRSRPEARFDLSLTRTGDTLAGTATIVTREETVPMMIVLRRAP